MNILANLPPGARAKSRFALRSAALAFALAAPGFAAFAQSPKQAQKSATAQPNATTGQAPKFTFVDLGTLQGSGSSRAYAINDLGHLAGESDIGSGANTHATLFADGTITDLGSLPGNTSTAYGINNLDQAAGSSALSADSFHAALFANGMVTDLGTLGGTASVAIGINDAGQVVGQANTTGDHGQHAALFAGGTVTDLAPGVASSYVASINSAGVAVGTTAGASSNHAAIFTNGTVTDLGTFGGTASDATAINDSGVIVGSVINDNSYYYYYGVSAIFANGTATYLGPFDGRESVPSGINKVGQIVGNLPSSSPNVFFYTAATGMLNLNTLAVSGSDISFVKAVNGINNWGQIAGAGSVTGTYVTHAVLLNPTNPLFSITGSSQDTKLVSGMDYNLFPAFTNPTAGSDGTVLSFLDGTAGSAGKGTYGRNRDLVTSYESNAFAGSLARASDVVNVQGAAGDAFVIQLTYDAAQANTRLGGEANAVLAWLNPATGTYQLAVQGNTVGSAQFAGNRAYNVATDFQVGLYGVDTANHVVWAVVNHGGDFVASNPAAAPISGVPAITSAAIAPVLKGAAFSFQITATNNPTSYGATGLPPGLSINPTTGLISGMLGANGVFPVTLTATNSSGTGTATLNIDGVPSFFTGQIALSEGVYYLTFPNNGNIFGYYAYLSDPNYIYHFDLGFEYVFDANDGKGGVYFYDFTSSDFFYTSATIPFPYLYDFDLKAFLYYYPDPTNPQRYNTNGVRYFYNLSTGKVISK